MELEQSCEHVRVRANEMEKLVTSVVAAKKECRLVDLLFSTKNYRAMVSTVIEAMTNAENVVIGMIADVDALAFVNRDGVGAACCALLKDILAQQYGAIGDVGTLTGGCNIVRGTTMALEEGPMSGSQVCVVL